MVDDTAALESLLRLLDEGERRYPYVTLPRLRRLAAQPQFGGIRRQLPRLLRRAQDEGLLFADERLRLTRTDAVIPVHLYRLNRRHPRVRAALGLTDEL